MDKLTYTRFANNAITIDLHNGYTVIAMKLFDRSTGNYEVTLYIKDNTINLLDLIEAQEKVTFYADNRTINSSILNYIAHLLSDGFFDYYINRYNYMMKCFDRGNELFEKERLLNIRNIGDVV